MNRAWLIPWRWPSLIGRCMRTIDHGDDDGRRDAERALAEARKRDPEVRQMVKKLNHIYVENGLGQKFVQALGQREQT